MVIAIGLLSKDLLSGFDVGNVLSDADMDQSVLEPTKRSFHFSFGLFLAWGEKE